MKLVHWPLMDGLLHYVQRGGDWAAHPSKANVPITVLLYNNPLLGGFNVPTKGLNTNVSRRLTFPYHSEILRHHQTYPNNSILIRSGYRCLFLYCIMYRKQNFTLSTQKNIKSFFCLSVHYACSVLRPPCLHDDPMLIGWPSTYTRHYYTGVRGLGSICQRQRSVPGRSDYHCSPPSFYAPPSPAV